MPMLHAALDPPTSYCFWIPYFHVLFTFYPRRWQRWSSDVQLDSFVSLILWPGTGRAEKIIEDWIIVYFLIEPKREKFVCGSSSPVLCQTFHLHSQHLFKHACETSTTQKSSGSRQISFGRLIIIIPTTRAFLIPLLPPATAFSIHPQLSLR